MTAVDLNIDLGELADEPEELFTLATVANIACGGHAGDRSSMARAVGLAIAHGARIAAHPSYPDRARFGRVSVEMPKGALAASVEEQCAAIGAIASEAGTRVALVKPHGALYHDTRNADVAEAVLDGVSRALGLAAIVGPPRGALRELAIVRGHAYLREGFADRAYRDGRLVPRAEPGALILDPSMCAAQAVRLVEEGEIETLCVHGDTSGAVAIARAVRTALAARGVLAASA
jgi:UPF0271 protein